MKREASNQPIWSLLFRDKGQPFFRDIKASNYSPALFGHGTTGWDASSNLRKSAVNHGHQPPMQYNADKSFPFFLYNVPLEDPMKQCHMT